MLPNGMKNSPFNRPFIAAAFVLALSACQPSPLDLAAKGDVERFRKLAAEDPALIHARNDLDKTPLHYAVTNGRTEMIAYLLEQGADIDAADATGMTPLHVATVRHAPDRVKEVAQLLDAGANGAAQDSFGDTPLHSAAMHGKIKILNYLLERGLDPMVKNREDFMPLDLAKRHRQSKIVERLEAVLSARPSP